MTVRPVVVVGEPVLHRPTRPVTPEELGGASLRALVDDLFETMDAANGVGLAANQIADDRRVFVFDCPDPELGGERRRGAVVNPVLTADPPPQTMPDPDEDEEGCLSVPGESFPTGRAATAEVHGVDVDGNEVVVTGTGYLARCLQHETDHLDGHVYLDRLVGRYRRAAKRAVRDHGWGVPGHSWLPGVDPDPFGH
ncbi:peptide deformylase [Actinomycetospora cinnamomea]|uniref:peptide deformylase n=1 Tax=Actinomycetospora cinnamomea TaxID=663609 RepID=UPI000E320B50|nr:peptide deformylase [Actinomycetospora cinnamomea]